MTSLAERIYGRLGGFTADELVDFLIAEGLGPTTDTYPAETPGMESIWDHDDTPEPRHNRDYDASYDPEPLGGYAYYYGGDF